MQQTKILLEEKDMPTSWYNVMPDLPEPMAPPLDPETKKPIAPEKLSAIFPMSLIEQEMSGERWIDIPEPIQEIYRLYRPSPLVRARRLEQAIGSKARIYYKDESVSPAGSHKPNTAVAQAYYNKMEGVRRLATETGAGQWGTALSFACKMLDMKCTVYMVRCSYDQKPYRGIIIRAYGGEVFPSPSRHTSVGRKVLEQDPNSGGSLGLAISEAVEDAAQNNDTKYALGSVLNHVIHHQTITGLEVKKQLEIAGETPDVLIGCVGGGSNFGGLVLPYMPEKLEGQKIRFMAVEPQACPTLTKGRFAYDYGDMARQTPLIKMYTLGHGYFPPPIHSGGLRYHGEAPIVSHAAKLGLLEARAYFQNEVFDAARLFMQTEGFLPAPETAHAIKAAIDAAKEADPGQVVVFLYSGHGLLDLGSYDAYLKGELKDQAFSDDEIEKSLSECPEI
ncbi:pyridoxal-phosphate dependent TrpB-like enzyme [Desulfonatronospira thiodismutans ASO3-1]|uniref:Tryptophan synthase beta chain n=1 Tax=Desulfonatronospira thiodismutans ASO3-1 TaxID=555779 RepID=D6SUQ9_9BACT|nr:TrpB-like pyridoxal phosphate-dependent enzyme [Desulfonatronospira thiodismutans]EFI33039.1 pyridoxal-phosphate dependent TrpB-like enzyme [Desulfonatronospira thiodismutans ASO3-1]